MAMQKLRRKRKPSPRIPETIIELNGKPVDYKDVWAQIEQGLKGSNVDPDELLMFKAEVHEPPDFKERLRTT
jgi:hypothetical protein